MTYPSGRDWAFSVKSFIAAMLALYLALYFELPRPYWAMASVYIVSNPFVGATRSKSLYRAMGTLLGAAAAVFFIPPLVDTPLLLSVTIALWTGCMLFLAITDRTARSYVFMLAGYTLPLIAFPTVNDPSTVFDVAVARSEEIILGIVCATVVNSTLFPNRLGPALSERSLAWFNDAIKYMGATLNGKTVGKELSAARQRLAASVNGLELLLSQLAYDDTRPDIVQRAHTLRGRMSLLLPMASALSDPLEALRAHGALPVELEALIGDITTWIGSKDASHRDAQADAFRAQLDALEPASASADLDRDASWNQALLSSLLWRLRLLVDLWQDCRSLREIIDQDRTKRWTPHLRHWRLGGAKRHIDWPMMLFSAFPAVVATFGAAVLWIATGWADGAAAVTLVAVSCSFFAALDQPAPQIFAFFVWTIVATVLAGVYLFVVLPNVHDFPMLVIMFAVPFICVGTLIPQPRFTLATMLTAVNTATFMSIQSAYDANFLTFVNSNSAGCAGLLFAFICIRIARPFGAELAAARLVRAGWADVVNAASPHAIAAQNNMASRMLDRLMQLLPRLNASDDKRHPSVDSFRDLRVGLNALDLQHIRRTLDSDSRMPIDSVLAGIRQYFQDCINHRTRLSPPSALAERIDTALKNDAAARGALHALVGLRLSLFPAPLSALPPDSVSLSENPA